MRLVSHHLPDEMSWDLNLVRGKLCANLKCSLYSKKNQAKSLNSDNGHILQMLIQKSLVTYNIGTKQKL